MKRIFFSILAGFLVFITACYYPETIETRIIFDDDDPPVVIIHYQNISSSEKDMDDLKESFDGLIKDMYGDELLVDYADKGLLLRKRRLYIENNQLYAELVGDAKNLENLYSIFVRKDERFMVYDGDDSYEIIETNGKIFKTDTNTLVVWPEDEKEIYWKERLLLEGEPENDVKRFYQNVSKLVAMFKEYQEKEEL